jgi:hypothetical protein
MPFALIVAGLLLLVSGVRGTTSQLTTLVKADFTGKDNFTYWIVAMIVLGSLGYVDKLRPLSNALMGLVILVLFLKNGTGFFTQFEAQI